MAKGRNQSVDRILSDRAHHADAKKVPSSAVCDRELPTAHLIFEGVRAWRVGHRAVAYEALTHCSTGRVLTKAFCVGRRRAMAVVTNAIAERRRQLVEAQYERE